MKFQGCYTAIVTPFAKDDSIDEEAYRRLVRIQIKAGIAGILVSGSTGEAATLTHEEYRRLLLITMEESRGGIAVIAGVGTNATWKAVEMVREAESLGVDAISLLTPYYNKPTQEGLLRHFTAVAVNTRLPISIYNIPGRTAVNVAPKTLARLADACPNVIAVKESGANLDQVSETLSLTDKLTVLAGDDSMTIPMMAVGARGIVSVVSNIAPRQMVALCKAFDKGDTRKAAALHIKLFPLLKPLFVETNPIPVKAALELMGLCRGDLRLPLTTMTPAARAVLKKEMKAYGLI
jgi:4-hydroxy-tetrahydrodipicolinate synthase